jgi:hypothetical protein
MLHYIYMFAALPPIVKEEAASLREKKISYVGNEEDRV